MKRQPFFTKLKKVLAYPFDLRFINKQQHAVKLLSALYESYYGELKVRYSEEKSLACQEIFTLRNELYNCWNLKDVTRLLSKQITIILWSKNNINIKTFDLKTGWFLWEKIFLHVDLIQDPSAIATAKRQLMVLQHISSTFDLGKYIPSE